MEANEKNYGEPQQEKSIVENENTGNLGESVRGRSSMNSKMESDTKDKSTDGSRDIRPRTFNEEEEHWKAEQNTDAQANRNNGTRNNNWDASNQMQRENGLHDEDEANPTSHGRYNDNEPNDYGQENDRRNREELE